MTNIEVRSDATLWSQIFNQTERQLKGRALKRGLKVVFRVPCPGRSLCVSPREHLHPGRVVTGTLALEVKAEKTEEVVAETEETKSKWLVLGERASYFIDTNVFCPVEPQALIPLNLEDQCEALIYEEVGASPWHIGIPQVLGELHKVYGLDEQSGGFKFQRCLECGRYYPHQETIRVRARGHAPLTPHTYCFPQEEGQLIARMWDSWRHSCRVPR